jgi:hypothetical protein
MLQIVSQTNLDTVIFMSDDTPMSQVVGLNLGLLKRSFVYWNRGIKSLF